MDTQNIQNIFNRMSAFINNMADANYFSESSTDKFDEASLYIDKLNNINIHGALTALYFETLDNTGEFWVYCDNLQAVFNEYKDKIDDAFFNLNKSESKTAEKNIELLGMLLDEIEYEIEPDYLNFQSTYKQLTTSKNSPTMSNVSKIYEELESLISDFNEEWSELPFVKIEYKTLEQIIKGDKWGVSDSPKKLAQMLDKVLIDASINQAGLKKIVNSKVDIKEIIEYIDTIDKTIDIHGIACCALESGGKEYDNNYISFTTYFALKELYDAICRVNESIIESKSDTPNIHQTPQQKKFEDFLLNCNDKKAVIEKMKNQLIDAKPKKIAAIIFALSDLKYIDISEGNRASIYKAIFSEFGYKRGLLTLERGVNTALRDRDYKNIGIYKQLFSEMTE